MWVTGWATPCMPIDSGMARVAILCLSALIMACGAGCAESAIAAAGASAGFGLAQGQAESFISGELKAARLVPLQQAVDATLAAAREAHVQIKKSEPGPYSHYIVAKAEGGPKIKIHLKAKSPMITKIEVRVGFMGDQAVSRLVLSRIDQHLGIQPLPVLPVEESPYVAPTARPANGSNRMPQSQ